MKTRLLTIAINIFLLLAFAPNSSYASDEKAYVAKENEELYGTWVNEDYNGSRRYAKFEFKADGTFTAYLKTTDEIPYMEGTYIITDKWTESSRDICYKMTWKYVWFPESGYLLKCISNSGSAMETANSFSDYPSQIDRTESYPTYIGIHYRKQR